MYSPLHIHTFLMLHYP